MKIGILGVLVLVATAAASFFVYDLLFSKPGHDEGVIIEKIFIPGKLSSGQTPYGGVKRSKYFVTRQKEDQWIAVVVVSKDTVKVHCHPDHYKVKEVGEKIHFKKYEGHLVHIDYFAHNEEEDN
jgi:co-chaperonin GroES (HSP10)